MHDALRRADHVHRRPEHPEFGKYDCRRCDRLMAGAPCPIEVMRRVKEPMNIQEVTIVYGMTETGPVSFQSATDDRWSGECRRSAGFIRI